MVPLKSGAKVEKDAVVDSGMAKKGDAVYSDVIKLTIFGLISVIMIYLSMIPIKKI